VSARTKLSERWELRISIAGFAPFAPRVFAKRYEAKAAWLEQLAAWTTIAGLTGVDRSGTNTARVVHITVYAVKARKVAT
jgi:hypothetical protein